MSYKTGYGAVQEHTNRDMYRSILRRVNPDAVLDHYGAQNIYRKGDEIIHSCLLDRVYPHHTNGDRSPSAALNTEKLVYNCFTGGGGDLLWFIQEMERCDRVQALDKLARIGAVDWQDSGAQNVLETVRKLLANNDFETPMPTYSTFILEPWLAIHPYMTEERGISENTIVRYKVGYDQEDVKIVIPHFWGGKLVGYQKRALSDPRWPQTPMLITSEGVEPPPKYHNSPGFPKESTLFNYDNVVDRGFDTVVVVESVMSILKAETWVDEGFEEYGNLVGTFSGKVNPTQVELLKRFGTVILVMDNDISGWSGTVKLYNGLKNFCKVYIVDAPEGMDIGDLTKPAHLDAWLDGKRLGALVIGTFKDRIEEVKRKWDSKSSTRSKIRRW
jgi:DNA primase